MKPQSTLSHSQESQSLGAPLRLPRVLCGLILVYDKNQLEMLANKVKLFFQ